jgi:hypothetical protein
MAQFLCREDDTCWEHEVIAILREQGVMRLRWHSVHRSYATSALCECGSGAPRRRAPRGPCLCINTPGGGGAAVEAVSKPEQHRPISTNYRSLEVAVCGPCPNEFEKNG